MTAMEAYNEAFAESSENVTGPLDETQDLVRLIDERVQKAMEPITVVLRQIIKDQQKDSADLDHHHDWIQDATRHLGALRMMVGATQRNRLLYKHYLSTHR